MPTFNQKLCISGFDAIFGKWFFNVEKYHTFRTFNCLDIFGKTAYQCFNHDLLILNRSKRKFLKEKLRDIETQATCRRPSRRHNFEVRNLSPIISAKKRLSRRNWHWMWFQHQEPKSYTSLWKLHRFSVREESIETCHEFAKRMKLKFNSDWDDCFRLI